MRHKVIFMPRNKPVMARNGENILETSLKNRIVIPNRCRGKGSCTMCRVILNSAHVSMPSPQEIRMLGEKMLEQGVRLACQTRIYGPLEVNVPEEAWKKKVKEHLLQKEDEEI